MAIFHIGQRVKKVRGTYPGATGTVRGFDVDEAPWDIVIQTDVLVRNSLGEVIMPGECADCFQMHWEPIVPEGHQPAEITVEELLPFLKTREVSDVAV